MAALHTLDGAAGDLEAEAARHTALLGEAPVDLAVLGLGRNGHVAFDEPGSDLAAGVRLTRLAATTREDAAAGLAPLPVPELGLTTGLGTLLACRELLLLVTGLGQGGGPPRRAGRDAVARSGRRRCCARTRA